MKLKVFFLLILFPALSFGQLNDSDTIKLAAYSARLCDCVDDFFNEIHPRVSELVILLGSEDKEEAMIKVEQFFSDMTESEQNELMEAFSQLESEVMDEKMTHCLYDIEGIDTESIKQIDEMKGPAYDFFRVVVQEINCELLRSIFSLAELNNKTNEAGTDN